MLNPAEKNNYLGNPNVKKDGVAEEWTEESVKEYAKCMNDPSVFCKNLRKDYIT